MENINTTATTLADPSTSNNLGSTSVFVTSPRGYAFAACVDGIDLLIDASTTNGQHQSSAPGLVGVLARTPKIPAWSPPLC